MAEPLPQKFRINDEVRIKQDGSAPRGWASLYDGEVLVVVGAHIDRNRPGRVAYCLSQLRSIPEDWLESAHD